MIKDTLPTSQVQSFYDRIGDRYDLFEIYEGRAKQRARQRIERIPRQRLLNVGVGTGKEQVRLQEILGAHSSAFGLDISPVMLRLARQRGAALLCQADARRLPYTSTSFQQLYCAYVLDLIPLSDIPIILGEFYRVLKSSGRLLLLALTEGVNVPSRALVAGWKLLYRLSPLACGGCRPLQLAELVCQAGFVDVKREVVVQLALPSEIISARKP